MSSLPPQNERQSLRTQRNHQVGINASSAQVQTPELRYDQVNQAQNPAPPQIPISQNGIVIDQQGRRFFSGQVEQGQQGGFYRYYLPQVSQQQIEAWHLKGGNGLWNQPQGVQVDTSKPPPPIAKPLPAVTPRPTDPIERAPLIIPHRRNVEYTRPDTPPRQTVVNQVKMDPTTAKEWAEIFKIIVLSTASFLQ